MDRYIFGEKSNIHILDLSQTVPLLHQALMKVREIAAQGGRILFVGTKRQAADHIKASAQRCAQYFVNSRWLGGTLTNWQTVSKSIQRLRELEQVVSGGGVGLTKKEVLNLTRERQKLDRSLGGIASMGGVPDLMFVVDTNKEAIAIKEARKLGIPVVAVVDSNCDPDEVTYPIPGNDDAARAIQLYCDLIADAVLDGLTENQVRGGADIGASARPLQEVYVREPAPATPTESPIDGPTGANY
jgi:small subunit ribosomal protein S2